MGGVSVSEATNNLRLFFSNKKTLCFIQVYDRDGFLFDEYYQYNTGEYVKLAEIDDLRKQKDYSELNIKINLEWYKYPNY